MGSGDSGDQVAGCTHLVLDMVEVLQCTDTNLPSIMVSHTVTEALTILVEVMEDLMEDMDTTASLVCHRYLHIPPEGQHFHQPHHVVCQSHQHHHHHHCHQQEEPQ